MLATNPEQENVKTANTARGEVSFEIRGETIILCADMDNVSKLLTQLKVQDLVEVEKLYFPYRDEYIADFKRSQSNDENDEVVVTGFDKYSYFDLPTTLVCVNNLCISHTPIQLKRLLHYTDVLACGLAVFQAFFLAFHDDDNKDANEGKERGLDKDPVKETN